VSSPEVAGERRLDLGVVVTEAETRSVRKPRRGSLLLEEMRVCREGHRRRVVRLPSDLNDRGLLQEQERHQGVAEVVWPRVRAQPGLGRRGRGAASRGRDLGRERVLACGVRLLDRGFLRIGSEGCRRRSKPTGSRRSSAGTCVSAGAACSSSTAPPKGGKRRVHSVVDPHAYLRSPALKCRRSGAKLLAYRNRCGWADVRSEEINEYLKKLSGDDFSAKDFRTWNATVLAAVALAVSACAARSKTASARAIARSVHESHYLGNTAAVCRGSYIDPRVFDRYRDGLTIGGALDELGDVELGQPATQRAVDDAVLDLLERDLRSPAPDRVGA
jgi:DNA topoisomerase I